MHSRVIVIGAGMAGLSAAEHLCCSGMKDVLVLEATNRYGGRIHTIEFGEGKLVELGANWIHGGTPDNCIFALANAEGVLPDVLTYVERHIGKFVTSSGEKIDQTTSFRLCKVLTEILDETKDLSPLQTENMEEYLSEKLVEVQLTATDEEKTLIGRFSNYFRNYVAFHGGDDLCNLSAWGYGSFEDLPGGDVKIPTGFSSIVESIVAKLPLESILFNHDVTKVVYQEDQVRIVCSNGQQFTADYVILTVSLGVLKANHLQLFDPPLPEDKLKVIQRTGFGNVAKVFLYYARPFWKPGTLKHINFTWTDEEYENRSPGEDWTIAMNGIEEVLNNPNVLMSWIGGRYAVVVENLPKQTIAEGCSKVLRQFLGDNSIPVPDLARSSLWCSSKCFLGTYSYPSCLSEEGDQDMLASPLPSSDNPRLLFAGEATHFKHFSTVHGARESGIREASRIFKLLKLTK